MALDERKCCECGIALIADLPWHTALLYFHVLVSALNKGHIIDFVSLIYSIIVTHAPYREVKRAVLI